MLNWLDTWLGLGNAAGGQYLFWSGIVGDFGLFGVALTLLRKHNCEVRGCPRMARHATAAGHKVCRRHHPEGHLTEDGVRLAHELEKLR